MTRLWLDALLGQHEPMVLVTVASTTGSVPREAGAKMLVTAKGEYDTIGGGHLEFMACAHARAMLQQADRPAHWQHFPLGPTLGQCCGGAVVLAFEPIDACALAGFKLMAQRLVAGQSSCRVRMLADVTDGAGSDDWIIVDGAGKTIGQGSLVAASLVPAILAPLQGKTTCQLLRDARQRCWMVDPWQPFAAHLILFGAGHVGSALIATLAALPCRVTWVDEREARCAPALPANVFSEATDTPEAVIAAAQPGDSYLVMTHSHPLDQQLCEQILRRGDFGWFGLIGSRTKRILFERRLAARGIDAAMLARMCCPIGLPGIDGKQPAVIAIAVAAQLLQVWQQQACAGVPQVTGLAPSRVGAGLDGDAAGGVR
ncbi:MAG: xanthine dehydrogenase accessory protein XdhC [Janthinobacterium lividum]